MMQLSPLYAAIAAFVGAVAALAIYHGVVVRPALRRAQNLLDLHDGMIGGASGGAGERLTSLESGLVSLRSAMSLLGGHVAELEGFSATDISRCGFIRYDAFADSESGLSYALALLNRQGDGVVLTSIYSRADTRTFGKAVSGFKPAANASAEELEAIERARQAAT